MPFNGNSSNTSCWNLGQLRAAVQREILDPTAAWWTVAELNQYLNDWQSQLESRFEFVWGTATVTTSLSTLTLTNIDPSMLRMDAIYIVPGTGTWGIDTSTRRIVPRSRIDIDQLQLDWAQVTTNTGLMPVLSWQDDIYTVSFWPPTPGSVQFVFEYPSLTTMTADSDVMSVPCWTRYSAAHYCAYRAYSRFGPNQDLPKAARRKRRWEMCLRKFKKVYDAYLPEHSTMLRPGRRYAGNILIPRQNGTPIAPSQNGNI